MSHCAFQTQFASIVDLLAQAAQAEIHRRVDDRCALVTVEVTRSRKDIDALKRKCVMMEIELRRVKGRSRRRVRIAGTSDRCPASLKRDTGPQHPRQLHNIQESTLRVLNDEIRSPDIKDERVQENVAFLHEQRVRHIPPQENTASPKAPFENPEVQNSALLHTGTYTEPSEQLKLEEERLRLQVKKDIKEEEEETVGFKSNTSSGDPLRYDPLWPSVLEATRSQNSPVLSQTHRNHQRPPERPQKEPSKSMPVSAKEQIASAWCREVTQCPGHGSDTFPGYGARGTPGGVRRIRPRRCSTVDSVQRFSCSFCAKTFKRCDQLKEHLRSHTGEKPFMCVQCGHSFTKHSNLTRHAAVHSGEKPFQCVQCGKCFTRRCNLTSHQRIHSGNIT